jgi:hypothetical protein
MPIPFLHSFYTILYVFSYSMTRSVEGGVLERDSVPFWLAFSLSHH